MVQCGSSPASDVSTSKAASKRRIDFLAGGGEMGERMRPKDWSGSPLGPPETWSQSVKTAVSICLNSRFPILLWLGPELRLVYNDAYIPFLGETKHPAALGAPGQEVWGEIWSAIGPMHKEVAAGRAISVDHFQMFFSRRLPREEVYVTFGYSAILGDDGRTVEGVFCACTETTEKIVGERRLATLRDLGARRPDHRRSVEIACRDAAEVLQANPLDVPFAAIYLLDEQGEMAHLVAGTRIPNDPAAFPAAHPARDGDEASQLWPLARVAATGRLAKVNDLPRRVGFFPAGPWPDAVETGFVLPLSPPPQARPAGFLIAGVSPRRVLNADYRSFLNLVAGHIATSIGDARAFEAERKRAEALAELDRAKTAFSSNVSHEFRTPLTLMLSPLEEVLAKPDEEVLPENRELVRIAHRNALRLLRLVNTLLDVSRAEAGRIEASYGPEDLAALTIDIASNFRSACERADLSLDVDCPPLGEPIYVDREMWEKIVLNLLSNAFKFTLQGRIGVALRADEGKARLTVSDTGVGIPQAGVPRIFERFYRVDGQGGRTHEGTGIGLALVQDLVRLHGGEITVESTIGQGATFTVALPLGRTHLPTGRIGARRALASTLSRADAFVQEALRWLPAGDGTSVSDAVIEGAAHSAAVVSAAEGVERGRVLLADDNADMRDYLGRLLARRGYDVEAFADAEAALAAATRRKPDLVLTDLMMPRLDGLGLVAALRRDPTLFDVPAIILSARASEEARVEGLGVGADDYLIKPFSARELLARVGSNLALSQLRAEQLEAMSRLNELSSRLATISDVPSLLNEVLDAAIELQRADFGTIQLYDKETRTLEIVVQRGFGQEFLDHFHRVSADEGSACGQALKRRARILIQDVNLDPEFEPHRRIAAVAGFRAVQSTPLVERGSGEAVGMLSTHFRNPHPPSARDLRLTDLYARQAADIIALRVSERHLRESEARLQAAIDLVGLTPYSWDPVTGALQWDARLKAMWGLPPDAHVDEVVFRAGIHPDDRPRVEAALAACIDPSGDGVYKIQYRVIGITDGVERWVSTYGRTLFDEHRRPVRFIGAALDITDRKHAEAALRESEERFRQFATHSQDVLWLFDIETSRHQYVSPAFERIWGSPVDATWGPDRWLKTVHPDDRERTAEALERVLQGEGAVHEYRIVRPNGAVRRIRETLFPIRGEQGRVRRVGGIAQNITTDSGSLVYVVDGNQASRETRMVILRGAGYDVKEFASARAFLEMAAALIAGCVVLDIRVPEAGGLTIPRELKARRIPFPVVVLGQYDGDTGLGVRAMKAGAVDFLQVPYEREMLLTAVGTALADLQETAERDRMAEHARAHIAEMSGRERQVLDRMLAGGTNKSIAKELGISPRTVEVHRARVMERLGAKTLPEAVLMATSAGLHPPSGERD